MSELFVHIMGMRKPIGMRSRLARHPLFHAGLQSDNGNQTNLLSEDHFWRVEVGSNRASLNVCLSNSYISLMLCLSGVDSMVPNSLLTALLSLVLWHDRIHSSDSIDRGS